ncbi:hypothetical protein S7335_2790 [Synechococcus sp. PCC 7335]|uniref:hypothetical protein n=1 Tax=Synechococcus sp. (strain ATCC 29403 / PCC 7335) TaxID=91464 RepID=UPI00017EC3E3|nr:hypothetical protein [Synechococcus sp. PCC 7335]EDX85091.1 hypothetical protein S7335_2790 [Synechococcus sp. PCC 7335]
MAYDSKTYGQSPFGNSPKPDEEPGRKSVDARDTTLASNDRQADKFPPISAIPGAQSAGVQPVERASKLGLIRADDGGAIGKTAIATGLSKRKSRTSRSNSRLKVSSPKVSRDSTATKPARKSKKAKSNSTPAKTLKAAPETVEVAIARRFQEEDRSAYLSLFYKTGISGLIWAVLRLVRYQLSERAIATINIILHPVLVSMLALGGTIGLTFWLRRILRDLALHTHQLAIDAEVTDGKNYRPTLEIVGDSLEYNPKLRQHLARLSSAASILICTLISYIMTSLLLPWE